MPKRDRHGQAEIWSEDQFQMVTAELSPKMRAIFSICYYTGCRVSEARRLKAEDVVGSSIMLRKDTTKTKRTRAVPMHPQLQQISLRRICRKPDIYSPVTRVAVLPVRLVMQP